MTTSPRSRAQGSPTKADLLAQVTALRAQLGELEQTAARAEHDAATARAALNEARDQQAATVEILRVIRRSPTDAQPVFEAIAESARRW